MGTWAHWQKGTKYKRNRQNLPDIYVCVFVYVKKYACVSVYVCMCAYVCLCAYVCICMCWCLCRCVWMCLCICACVYLWHAKYIKFVSLAYMHVTKSAKCESGTTSVSMCVCVCPFICMYLYCVCGVPNIKLVYLVWMCKNVLKSAKCRFF